MDKDTRTQIQRATQAARSLLEQEYAAQLEGTFDILPDGTIADAPGSHLDAEQQLIRQKLVAAIHHHRPHVATNAEAVAAYLREAAFTTLNRFVALKMLEARDLVQQCISQGDQSSGFKEFSGLAAGLVQLPDKGYRLYIECLFDEIAREVQVLFDRRDPASLLWPRRQALNDLLDILNSAELAGIWGEDETIGWVYQYFNSDEERKQMRAESQAPRNSRELAVRNQFFTPRYVVEFLTDNTLGRIWYEMRQGDTRLVEECEYLVRRPSEVFLGEGVEVPEEEATDEDLSQEELLKKTVYIPYRAKKDPRDLKVLDPACGSGHFLLYTFDLLLTIYEEGWADEASLVSETTGQTLRQEYSTVEELRAAVPGLILRYNLHGIDIDPRAAQIASLALWMRAQRAYNDLGIARGQRQPVRKTNVVVAEPMPGDADQLEEFAISLDKQLGQLIRKVFKKMELAGEAGSLLKIEEEIQSAIREIYLEIGGLFQDLDEQRWLAAEGALLTALKAYAEQAQNGKAYQRRLFAEDAARGFAFIDICRKRYDVALMNPPFGIPQDFMFSWYKDFYKDTYVDLYACSVVRGCHLAPQGLIGAITSRSFLTAKKLNRWRSNDLIRSIRILADLGLGVMDDAYVESAAYVLSPDDQSNCFYAHDFQLTEDKETAIRKSIDAFSEFTCVIKKYLYSLPSSKILYSIPPSIYRLLSSDFVFEPNIGTAREGMRTFDDFRFVRLRWEVNPRTISSQSCWEPLAKGGEFSRYYSDIHLVVKWNQDGSELAEQNRRVNGQVAQSRQALDYYRLPGATYSKRSVKGFSVRALPQGCIIGTKGPAVLSLSAVSSEYLVGWLNSRLINFLVTLQANFSEYNTGIIKNLPWRYPDSPSKLEEKARQAILAKQKISAFSEANSCYVSPYLVGSLHQSYEKFVELYLSLLDVIDESHRYWDDEIDRIYSVDSQSLKISSEEEDGDEEEGEDEESQKPYTLNEFAASIVSYSVGCVFGRWDIRLAIDQSPNLELPDPFSEIPSCPPGSLVNRSGFLLQEGDEISVEHREEIAKEYTKSTNKYYQEGVAEQSYPLSIVWPGILVDDEGARDDIVEHINKVFHLISDNGGCSSFEEELREALSVEGIREYIRKSGKGGFWESHIKTYSKSRRKAPIYWQLTVPSASYSIWLYYHRLTKDTFYRILDPHIKTKVAYEERQLTNLLQDAGSNPASSLRKEIAAQESFVAELRTFRDEIALIAPLWNPNLNDGVIINFAPLWRLVPHHRSWQKECKDCWDKLVKGEYDWAHLAMHLWPERVIPKCTKDRSLAIAHGLEEVFWEEDDATGKWKPRKVPKEAIAQLIQERSSPAVKDALKRLLEAPVPSSGTQRRSRRNQS